MIYYLVLVGLFFLAVPTHHENKKIHCIAAITLLLLFGGLRYEVGTDWGSYRDLFTAVESGTPFLDLREESGFLLLIYLSIAIGGNYLFFIFFLFSLSLGIKVVAIKACKANLNVSLLLYFSALFMIYDVNGLRQGLAMGLIMLAGWAASRRYTLYFFCLIGLAVSVHIASLIALPLYWMNKRLFLLKNPNGRLAVVFCGSIICYLISVGISFSDISSYLDFMNMGTQYRHFISNFNEQFNLLGAGTFQRIVTFLLITYLIDSINVPIRLKRLLYNCQVVSLMIYFLLSFNVEIMARMSFFYKCFDIITLSLIFDAQKYKNKYLYLIFIGLLTSIQVFRLLSIPEGGMLPYKNSISYLLI